MAPYAVGGTARTPSAICEKTSDTPALATTLAPLGALRMPLHCLHRVTNMIKYKCFVTEFCTVMTDKASNDYF